MHHSYIDILEIFFITLALVTFLVIFAKAHLFAEMQTAWYDFFNASRLMT